MGGKSSTSSQSVSIPPEVLARYNSVNARAEDVAKTPFQPYTDQFVAGLTPTQTAGIQNTNVASTQAQPYYNAATGLTLSGAQDVGALNQNQIGYYQNPYTQAVAAPTYAALQQQQGQERSQQQAQAIKSGAAFGERSGLQRAQLAGQQGLATAQALAPIYQQGYQQAVQTAQGQQGVVAADLARRMQAGQQVAGIGTAAQQAGLQGAQAQIAAGTVEQQTQQADLTARYQQFLQQRGYDFQTAQFLANIAMGTGSLSGSTTTTTQPQGFFSDERLKHDAHRIGETDDGLPIYSFKYNGDNKTQIGLMAQDVEKRKPEAVGLAPASDGKMYKTVDYDKATRQHKDYGGGVMGGYDASSMGGAVAPGLAGEGFADGGMPGMPNMGGMPGVMGYVPAANLPIGKLITADPKLLRQNQAGLGSAVATGKSISDLYDMGKSGVAWGKKQFAANGGLIVPRHGYAMGGGDDEEPTPYNPSEVMKGEDPMKDVLRSGSMISKSLQKPGGGGGGGQSGASQLSSALGLGTAAMNFGSTAAEFLPEMAMMFLADGGRTPFAYGGLIPRQHHADGERVIEDYSPEADLPAIGAQEAGLVVDQPVDDRLDRTLGALRRIESGGRYDITGPESRKGDRPYGAYQIMGANVPSWTEAAIGRRMTPEEFLKDDKAQDATARHRAGLYLKQYNDPRQVASMWLSGKPMEKAGDVADVLGTNVPKYISMFDRYYDGKDLAPRPPGVMGRSERTPSSYSGKGAGEASLGDVFGEYVPQGTPTSANFWVPALAGLGSMLASKNPTLLGAVGEGLVGGTGAYMSQQKQESELEAQKPITAARNVEALNALSLGLKKYNAFNRTNLTLAEFAKLKPSEIAKFAGAEAAKAASGSETAEPKYTYTPDEMSNLVIDRNGVKIPAASDPGYLTGYKAHYALYGDDPYGKAQMEFADKQLAATKDKTLSASGEYIPTPGAISSGQQGLNAQQKVEGSIKFQNAGADFGLSSLKIVNDLESLENAFARFKTGRDAAAKANLDNILTTIDPNNKYRLSSGAGADYDTIMKSAVALQLAQLSGLSARAPAAELNALNRVSPTANLNPDAVRKIIINAKAHNAYQQKMYDEYDPEQWGYDSTKYQKDFMNRNNYKEFLKEIEKSVPVGAGTEESRKVAPIPQSDWVVGKVYKDASGKEMRRTSSGWEKP